MLVFVLCMLLIGIACAQQGNGSGQQAQAGDNENNSTMTQNQQQVTNQIQARAKLKFQNKEINCGGCDISEEGGKLKMMLSNGRNAEIKIMPDRASETALERLRLRVCNESQGCSIELKEVGKGEGNKTRAAYEIKTQRRSKIFGLFGAKMKVQAQVDAESGEVIRVKKPWWAFLASEPEE